jgi:hypothetical protein
MSAIEWSAVLEVSINQRFLGMYWSVTCSSRYSREEGPESRTPDTVVVGLGTESADLGR